jgi:hypothetical protein
MFKDPKNAPPPETTKAPNEGKGALHPEGLKPWEDSSLSPNERCEAYKAFVHEKLQEIASAFDRAGEAKDTATQKEIMNSPETKQWMEEGTFLKTASAEEFCKRIESQIVQELLGKNFLGSEAWESQGIEVGDVPPIPESITKALLESECPLHPGERIKDTHLLVLVPKTVDDEPFSPLKLDELCATRKGSGDKLIYDGADWANSWKSQEWASAAQTASEWVLIPKRDPDPSKVAGEKHFRSKNIEGQHTVHRDYYSDYREVKTEELMTAVLLNDLVNGEPRMLDGWNYLRCVESNAFGGRVCVGDFNAIGLLVFVGNGVNADGHIGRALARKLKT